MQERTERDLLIWGWLRLTLGLAQIGLSVAALAFLLASGISTTTLIFMTAALIVTLMSRFLYHGKAGPESGQRQ